MTIDEAMTPPGLTNPGAWQYYWCEGRTKGGCACMGCANDKVRAAGYTKADWEDWVKRHPRPNVKNYSTYP